MAHHTVITFLIISLIVQTLSKPTDQVTDAGLESHKELVKITKTATTEESASKENASETSAKPRLKRRASYNGRRFLGFVGGK